MEHNLSSSRVVAYNAFYNLLGYGASLVYFLLLVPLIVEYLGLQVFGIWTLMLAVAGYVGLADLGLGTSFAKYVAEYATGGQYRKVNSVVLMGLVFYGVIALIALGAGALMYPILSNVLRIPEDFTHLANTAFLLALGGFGATSLMSVFNAVLTGLQRTGAQNLFMACFLTVKLIVLVALLVKGHGLLALMSADLLLTLLSVVPLFHVSKRYLPSLSLKGPFDWAIFRTLLRFGTQLQVSRFAETIQNHFDKFLLSRFIGLSAVSVYDFGARPVSRIRAIPLVAIGALMPAVSALQAENRTDRIRAGIDRTTRYLAIVAVPLFVFLAGVSEELIRVWLGQEYPRASVTIQVLCLGYFMNVMSAPLSYAAQGKGVPRYQMWSAALQMVLNIVLSTILVINYGFYGAVAGTAVALITGALVFTIWSGKKLFDYSAGDLLRTTLRPVLSVVPGTALLFFLREDLFNVFTDPTRLTLGLLLVGALIVFCLCYCFLLRLSGAITKNDREFLKNLLPFRFLTGPKK